MQFGNTFQRALDQICLSWVGKSMVNVSAPDCRETLPERVEGQAVRIVGQIVGDPVGCRGQHAAPLDFEMLDRRRIAPTRVITGRGLYILFDTAHEGVALSVLSVPNVSYRFFPPYQYFNS